MTDAHVTELVRAWVEAIRRANAIEASLEDNGVAISTTDFDVRWSRGVEIPHCVSGPIEEER